MANVKSVAKKTIKL